MTEEMQAKTDLEEIDYEVLLYAKCLSMAALSAAFRSPKPKASGRLLALECQFLLIQPETRGLEFLDLGLRLLTFYMAP